MGTDKAVASKSLWTDPSRGRYVPVARTIEGFRRTIGAEFGDGVEPLVECSFFASKVAASRLRVELPNVAIAIVGGSDLTALGAVRAARRRGLSVSDDVSVIGFEPRRDFADRPWLDPRGHRAQTS